MPGLLWPVEFSFCYDGALLETEVPLSVLLHTAGLSLLSAIVVTTLPI